MWLVSRNLFLVFSFSTLLFLQLMNLPLNADLSNLEWSGAEPIDIVYTWVDGSDAKWQEIRNHHFTQYKILIRNTDANTKNRFRNRDELRYSLRSVFQFAKFINHIYIVTFNQVPKWLKYDPRITIIDHQEIFPHKEDLPTFNSQSIESNLHRIPNLTEKFIYLNDDVFFTKELTKEDFFTDTGHIRFILCPNRGPEGPVVPGESAYDSSLKNTDSLLNSCFKNERRYKLSHAPFALKKSLMNEVESEFPHVFRLVSAHKFRMHSDYTVTNGLIQYYAYYTKQAHMDNDLSPMIRIGIDIEKNEKGIAKVKASSEKYFCMQDLCEDDYEPADRQVREFFESTYPDPAPWEKEESRKIEPKKEELKKEEPLQAS